MKKWILIAFLGVALAVALAALPYLLPTRIALGPCGRDWTSPSSFMPRQSPTRSESGSVGHAHFKICYGSPSIRNRQIFGYPVDSDRPSYPVDSDRPSYPVDSDRPALVPWGELWRLGANEPTRLFVDDSIVFAGVALAAGRYSVYALPGPEEWQIFISGSTFHWGNAISEDVRAQELGSGRVPLLPNDRDVEQMTFSWQPTDSDHGHLVFEWASARVEIPVARQSG